jgi:hypothetical protein
MNTCGDIDCGNYGVAPNFSLLVFKGNGAAQRKLLASVKTPALATRLGGHSLTSNSKKGTVSQAFEYQTDPRAWDDGREIACHHQKGNSECGIEFNIMSNEFLLEEIDRLRTHNGLLEGPKCGHCGARYLDRPDEFILTAHTVNWLLRGTGAKRKPPDLG